MMGEKKKMQSMNNYKELEDERNELIDKCNQVFAKIRSDFNLQFPTDQYVQFSRQYASKMKKEFELFSLCMEEISQTFEVDGEKTLSTFLNNVHITVKCMLFTQLRCFLNYLDQNIQLNDVKLLSTWEISDVQKMSRHKVKVTRGTVDQKVGEELQKKLANEDILFNEQHMSQKELIEALEEKRRTLSMKESKAGRYIKQQIIGIKHQLNKEKQYLGEFEESKSDPQKFEFIQFYQEFMQSLKKTVFTDGGGQVAGILHELSKNLDENAKKKLIKVLEFIFSNAKEVFSKKSTSTQTTIMGNAIDDYEGKIVKLNRKVYDQDRSVEQLLKDLTSKEQKNHNLEQQLESLKHKVTKDSTHTETSSNVTQIKIEEMQRTIEKLTKQLQDAQGDKQYYQSKVAELKTEDNKKNPKQKTLSNMGSTQNLNTNMNEISNQNSNNYDNFQDDDEEENQFHSRSRPNALNTQFSYSNSKINSPSSRRIPSSENIQSPINKLQKVPSTTAVPPSTFFSQKNSNQEIKLPQSPEPSLQKIQSQKQLTSQTNLQPPIQELQEHQENELDNTVEEIHTQDTKIEEKQKGQDSKTSKKNTKKAPKMVIPKTKVPDAHLISPNLKKVISSSPSKRSEILPTKKGSDDTPKQDKEQKNKSTKSGFAREKQEEFQKKDEDETLKRKNENQPQEENRNQKEQEKEVIVQENTQQQQEQLQEEEQKENEEVQQNEEIEDEAEDKREMETHEFQGETQNNEEVELYQREICELRRRQAEEQNKYKQQRRKDEESIEQKIKELKKIEDDNKNKKAEIKRLKEELEQSQNDAKNNQQKGKISQKISMNQILKEFEFESDEEEQTIEIFGVLQKRSPRRKQFIHAVSNLIKNGDQSQKQRFVASSGFSSSDLGQTHYKNTMSSFASAETNQNINIDQQENEDDKFQKRNHIKSKNNLFMGNQKTLNTNQSNPNLTNYKTDNSSRAHLEMIEQNPNETSFPPGRVIPILPSETFPNNSKSYATQLAFNKRQNNREEKTQIGKLDNSNEIFIEEIKKKKSQMALERIISNTSQQQLHSATSLTYIHNNSSDQKNITNQYSKTFFKPIRDDFRPVIDNKMSSMTSLSGALSQSTKFDQINQAYRKNTNPNLNSKVVSKKVPFNEEDKFTRDLYDHMQSSKIDLNKLKELEINLKNSSSHHNNPNQHSSSYKILQSGKLIDENNIGYDEFTEYYTELMSQHKRCGPLCYHLKRFYEKMDFNYKIYSNRQTIQCPTLIVQEFQRNNKVQLGKINLQNISNSKIG